MELSVIIPVYNSANSIESLLDRLAEALHGITYEVILVNDGSSDSSEMVCARLAQARLEITFISLRRNFGEFNAVMCGLNNA